ncbi:MAG: hypothetical protein V4659_13060 [Pseudomonadota bacterium]
MSGANAVHVGQAIVLCFAAWLVALGVLGIVRPERARTYIGTMGGTHRINLIEQALRLTVGVGFVAAAAASQAPRLFEIVGWFLIATAVLLALIPLKWHNGFARHAAGRLSPNAVRAAGGVGIALSGPIVWATVG